MPNAAAAAGEPPASRQASGVKVGEVTESSAIIWTRLTAQSTRNNEGRKVVGRPKKEDKLPKIGDAAEQINVTRQAIHPLPMIPGYCRRAGDRQLAVVVDIVPREGHEPRIELRERRINVKAVGMVEL